MGSNSNSMFYSFVRYGGQGSPGSRFSLKEQTRSNRATVQFDSKRIRHSSFEVDPTDISDDHYLLSTIHFLF